MTTSGPLDTNVRFTRRRLDWRVSGVLVGIHLSAIGALASCSSDDRVLGSSVADDADGADDADDAPDAGADGGGRPVTRPPDAATSDAGPRPVVCEAPPCAMSLTTTAYQTSEGFCALLQDGTVACWGSDRHGQLGRGGEGGLFPPPSATPAPVVGLSNVTRLERTCAIDEDGATWCWGTGPYLRDPSAVVTTERTPVKLPIPPAKRVGVSWNGVSNLAVGCAVVDTGVLCWGTNKNAQVAEIDLDASSSGILSPVPHAIPAGAPIEQIAVGDAAFVTRKDGTLLSWGANPPLGRVSSLAPDPHLNPVALSGVSSISVEQDNACAIAQGIGYCWGRFDSSDPGQEIGPALAHALPEPVPTPEPIVQIAARPASTHTLQLFRGCAVGVSGDVYCWGGNAYGQAGDGTKDYAVTPVKVAGLPAPTARVSVSPASTCALLTNGKVFCWGDNSEGQLGTGQRWEPSLIPVEVQLP